jgi:thymidine kinase
MVLFGGQMITPKSGYVYLICGSMYAGKTTELIRSLRRLRYAGKKILLFTLDSRFNKKASSHDGILIDSYYVEPEFRKKPDSIYKIIKELDVDVVGFDEIQFLSESYVSLFSRLASEGKIVMAAGLDQDFKCSPFTTTSLAMIEAEYVNKLNAVCSCGNPAVRNYRKIENDEIELEGAEDIYEAKCRYCYDKLME